MENMLFNVIFVLNYCHGAFGQGKSIVCEYIALSSYND